MHLDLPAVLAHERASDIEADPESAFLARVDAGE
jgi:hypothetical protein